MPSAVHTPGTKSGIPSSIRFISKVVPVSRQVSDRAALNPNTADASRIFDGSFLKYVSTATAKAKVALLAEADCAVDGTGIPQSAIVQARLFSTPSTSSGYSQLSGGIAVVEDTEYRILVKAPLIVATGLGINSPVRVGWSTDRARLVLAEEGQPYWGVVRETADAGGWWTIARSPGVVGFTIPAP